MGGGGRRHALKILSKSQERWSNVGHAAKDIVTVFFVTGFLVAEVGQMVEAFP